MQSEKGRNTRGVAWSAVERLGIQLSQFAVSMLLARMLMPSDYGLIAMLSIFIVLATTLIDSGMAQALVQRKSRSQVDFNSAWVFNVAVALVIYGVIYLAAPYIAQFYHTPELRDVTRVFSIVLVINSLSVVQQAIITINLDFKRQAVASLVGIAMGGCVAIAMAYLGYGVWALVAQQIISDSVRGIIIWFMARWRPTLELSLQSLKELSRFGSKIMVSGILHVIYVNMYPLIIGRHFTSTSLGLFNRATTIGAIPSTSISTIVDRALYPILCSRQDDCKGAYETLLRYLGMVCFAVFPAMVGLAVLARPTVLLLLGDRWVGVVSLLQIVAIAYMWDPIMKFVGSFIKSQGNPTAFLRAEITKKVVGVGILFASIPFGIEAMAGGLILYALADCAIVIFFARRVERRLGYGAIVRLAAPIAIMAALMGGVVWFVLKQMEGSLPFIQLLVAVPVGAMSYLILAMLLRREEPRQLFELIFRR